MREFDVEWYVGELDRRWRKEMSKMRPNLFALRVVYWRGLKTYQKNKYIGNQRAVEELGKWLKDARRELLERGLRTSDFPEPR